MKLNMNIKLNVYFFLRKFTDKIIDKFVYGQTAIYGQSQNFFSIFLDQIMVYSRNESLNLAKIFEMTIINSVLIGHSLKWYHWVLTKRNKLETNHFVFK